VEGDEDLVNVRVAPASRLAWSAAGARSNLIMGRSSADGYCSIVDSDCV